ncbi:hypothetical protein [Amycolatopsis sp. lyj-84]|uniref:hypothetical protein n=1 Tax=Amycolatopsis sp. lyj-84 TaxID=2789284 RepID=UPI0039799740
MRSRRGQKTPKVDVGEADETYERSYRDVAVRSIHLSVFGLGFYLLGEEPERALAVVVPPSVDVPHLIYRNRLLRRADPQQRRHWWMREPLERGVDAL